ncbi:hypothetical protein EV426DRAFT_153239 [Tirmania nivea]|nr:hypothetical protein EV426DRAFT_153239 [Tirmania nivea]
MYIEAIHQNGTLPIHLSFFLSIISNIRIIIVAPSYSIICQVSYLRQCFLACSFIATRHCLIAFPIELLIVSITRINASFPLKSYPV